MNRLRCGPIRRTNGPVFVTKYNADGTTTTLIFEVEDVRKAVDTLTTEEKLLLLKKLQEIE